jgi:3-methyl-2-oxobutanoate hydroxymethyltransferase
VGLVPNWATWTNFRAIGKTPEEALRVFQHAKDLENAGAAFLEVEVIPEQLAAYITQNVRMITMGMGCGTACDTQYLFSSDVLGTNRGHMPRHSKQYADIPALEEQVQRARVKAFTAFAQDVASSGYPEARHAIPMDAQAYEGFVARVQGAGR